MGPCTRSPEKDTNVGHIPHNMDINASESNPFQSKFSTLLCIIILEENWFIISTFSFQHATEIELRGSLIICNLFIAF